MDTVEEGVESQALWIGIIVVAIETTLERTAIVEKKENVDLDSAVTGLSEDELKRMGLKPKGGGRKASGRRLPATPDGKRRALPTPPGKKSAPARKPAPPTAPSSKPSPPAEPQAETETRKRAKTGIGGRLRKALTGTGGEEEAKYWRDDDTGVAQVSFRHLLRKQTT